MKHPIDMIHIFVNNNVGNGQVFSSVCNVDVFRQGKEKRHYSKSRMSPCLTEAIHNLSFYKKATIDIIPKQHGMSLFIFPKNTVR